MAYLGLADNNRRSRGLLYTMRVQQDALKATVMWLVVIPKQLRLMLYSYPESRKVGTHHRCHSALEMLPPAPNGPSPKLPPSASGQLISEFMPNVRSKQSKKPATQTHSGSSTPSHTKGQSTTTGNIADLTSAIAALELSTNPSLSTERRRCDCNASIHPLFSTAPNCLNCGKIICALEGLQPCSFCDAPILNQEEVQKMIKSLREERGVEKQAQHNTNIAVNRSGASTPRFGGATPDSGSGDEAQLRARQHRDKLLSFQRENAQRTKIHDEAADYDAVLTPGTTQWMSPMQRAAALKKQQAYLREMGGAE